MNGRNMFNTVGWSIFEAVLIRVYQTFMHVSVLFNGFVCFTEISNIFKDYFKLECFPVSLKNRHEKWLL